MIEEETTKNYLLDYRTGGSLGPMKIICINFAVAEGDDYGNTIDWLRKKVMENNREFTLGEFGPFKEEPPKIIKMDPTPEQVQEVKDYVQQTGVRAFPDSIVVISDPNNGVRTI